MPVTIEIRENDQLKETRQLDDGTYTIGRDPSAGIVLDSKTVSKNHATLTVENNTFRVTDNNSANGVYSRGVKISEKTFKTAFQIEMTPFTLRTAAIDEPDRTDAKSALGNSLGALVNRNINIIFSVVIVLAMLLCLATVYPPLRKNADRLYRQAHLDKGVLLSRYLAEMNRIFLENGEHAWIRTAPVRSEKGVIYAFVIDGYGKIIAPHEQQGDVFNWDGLPGALKKSRPMVGNGPNGEHIIFSPVVFRNQVKGAAIIGFSNLSDRSAPDAGIGAGTVFLLLILFALAVMTSFMLSKSLLSPLRELYEDIELAIKEGRDHIDFPAPYEALDNLKRIVNRLLLRKTGETSLPDVIMAEPVQQAAPTPAAETAPADQPAAEKDPIAAAPEQVAAIEGPWCLVDPEDYTLVGFSDTFTRDLGVKACDKGMHIIEAFDSDMIVIVTQVIETPDGQPIETEAAGKKFRVSGTRQHPDRPTVLIIFEEVG